MKRLPSYGKVYTLGHHALVGMFRSSQLVVEEKIDGSQLSFGMINGFPYMRSRGHDQSLDAPEKMFAFAAQTVMELFENALLPDGVVFRGEYLTKPKHNTLTYERVPRRNIILFDAMTGIECYVSRSELMCYGLRLNLEVVPAFDVDPTDLGALQKLMADTPSCLGGIMEGVVIKAYDQYDTDGKRLKAKVVSENFKERHTKDWKLRNPSRKDIVAQLVEALRTEARWDKAIQHAKEEGALLGEPKDIGVLLKYVNADLILEEMQWVEKELSKFFWPTIRKAVCAGFAEHYKRRLAESQAKGESDDQSEDQEAENRGSGGPGESPEQAGERRDRGEV